MAEEVSLPIGVQLAIVYLGINILVPLALTTSLSAVVLLSVRLSKYCKQNNMGCYHSKNLVMELQKEDLSDMNRDDSDHHLADAEKDLIGLPQVRKRRSSLVKESSTSSTRPGSSLSFDSQDTPQTVSPVSSVFSTATENRGKSGLVKRLRSPSSNNRVSPSSIGLDKAEPRASTSVSWAWVDEGDNKKRTATKKYIKHKKNEKRISRDVYTAPNNGSAHQNDLNPGSLFKDDMSAYDIW